MSNSQLRFRVGLFVIVALCAIGWLVFQFGKLHTLLDAGYVIAVHVPNAEGVHPGTAVKQHGIVVGRVKEIRFDEKRGGVLLVVNVDGEHRLRKGARAKLVTSLLGATAVDIVPGEGDEFLPPNSLLKGTPAADPFEIVNRMEERVATTLESFETTSREWADVGESMNTLLTDNQDQLHDVVEKSAIALEEFAKTMQTANNALGNADRLLGDPELQAHIQATLETLPTLASETREAVAAMRKVVDSVETNLSNLEEATAPIAEHSKTIVEKLDTTLTNLQSVSADLDEFSQTIREEEGTVQKLMTDPQLYNNLNNSAASLAALMRNLEPAIRDLRVFSDKVARHPELMGVGGALRGSSGVKEVESDPRTTQPPIRRAGAMPRAAVPRR